MGFTRTPAVSRNTIEPQPTITIPTLSHPGCTPAGPACREPFLPSTSTPWANQRLHRNQQLLGDRWRQIHPARLPSLNRGIAGASNPPDFGGELHTGFDDQRPVRMHGHAGLPFHHKSTVEEKRNAVKPQPHPSTQCSPLRALPVTKEQSSAPSEPSHLFIRFLNSSTIRSSSIGRCWTIGSPL